MIKKTFLVEIGTEELPPKNLRCLGEAFAHQMTAALAAVDLSFDKISWYASPRRLALSIAGLSTSQPERIIEKRGPAVAAAFDANGHPTAAAKGWAKQCGITPDQAQRLKTEQGEWLFYRTTTAGERVEALLPGLVATALTKLPANKLMRWGDGLVQFIRPVHTVVMLLNEDVIAGTILGVESGRMLFGHRFMGETALTLDHADHYLYALETRGKVLADYFRRKSAIKEGVEAVARQLGGRADISDALLEEVTSLVEWPVVMTAAFDQKFLAVPAEALVCTMKGDQKYFPVYDEQGKLLPQFIFVANIVSPDPQQIVAGNEKVVRPRLADAEFFFNTDCKQPLESHISQLNTLLFQKALGTMRDKTDRICELAGWIAQQIGSSVAYATRAAYLSKCDLLTNMVFEFTEIQGVMGGYYARRDGEAEEVAIAISEQYRPRFAGDVLPSNPTACALAIADKIDTLTGVFGIGQHPKGDKDPFALRRAALGILHIIIENNMPLDLYPIIAKAAALYGDRLSNAEVIEDSVKFMLNRFPALYQERGYSIDIIQAVLARKPTKPADFNARIDAVSYFCTLDEAAALASSNKRVANILAKNSDPLNATVCPSLLKAEAEITLAKRVLALESKLSHWFEQRQYRQALFELAQLRQEIDHFFDDIMVNTEDAELRINRLTLLFKLRQLFLHIADISLLQI